MENDAASVELEGLQHPVVAENDHKKRHWAFFAPAKYLWFRELEAQIGSNSCHVRILIDRDHPFQ